MNLEGVVLESKYSEHQLIFKGPMQQVFKDGFPMQEQKLLILQFDGFICEIDEMAVNNEWTEEDLTFLSRGLERFLKDPLQADVWIHELPKPGLPWPTYNETHHNQVPVVAQAIGMVSEALTYEERGRPGGPRESVVKKLHALLSDGPDDRTTADVDDDELAAV